jgi:hypothetical protein
MKKIVENGIKYNKKAGIQSVFLEIVVVIF